MLTEEKGQQDIAPQDTAAVRPAMSGANPLRFAVWAVVAVAFTALVLQYSSRHGRLLYLPVQDDITYISDGLDRLNVFYNSGVSGSFYYYRAMPPYRSAVGTYMASLGFALFGFKDWAPYATNALFIFIALWAVSILMDGAKAWHKAAAMVFVLCCPVSVATVGEFRPDLACGLFTALGVVALAEPFLYATVRRKAAVGALFGAALLIKPSIFPGTMLFAGAALALAILRDMVLAGKRPDWRGVFKSIAIAFGSATLVALPFFYFGWKIMVEYLVVNLVESERRKIWAIPGGLETQLLYYLDGPGGSFLLSRHLYLLLAVLAVGAFGILLARRRRGFLNVVYAGGMVGLTYAVPALTPGKNEFGGATFTWLMVLCCIALFKAALDVNRDSGIPLQWAAGFLLLSSLGSLYLFHMPRKMGDPGKPETTITNRFAMDVFNTVMDKLDEAPFGKRRIFVTTYGLINYQLLKYLSIRDDRGAHEVPMLLPPDKTEMKPFEEQMNAADLVLASEAGNGTVAEMMPSASVQDETLDMARRRDDLVEIRRFPTASGKQFFLFEKKGLFAGWYRSEGIGALDGPYPDRDLPLFRCGYGPSSKFYFYRATNGPVKVQVRCKSLVPRQQMAVQVDGRRLADLNLEETFAEFSWPFEAGSGQHTMEFVYSDWMKKADVPGAVVFAQIELTSPAAAAAVARR